jgi:NAD(P)-dependent dehydrogenase (short-subunit alcohol dehydrogenase family)
MQFSQDILIHQWWKVRSPHLQYHHVCNRPKKADELTLPIAGFSEIRKAELTAQIPLRRFGKPTEVADAIMFLLHNEYANNCILNLDGGLSAV